ncbi:hypothetical protein SaSA85_1718 [Streptococcus agalactiae]|nr:hypothetical protein SaSA85_1718 [Streptococcus agalactiae]AUP02537.1 hypothetical protein SaSA97_1725 [Streptococcus agalactiae]AUP05698.1 hypothetical protein SaSA132_1713 [Streptococcus agalactiae]AUP07341.1 hypothetical protein SaSA136_1710 [Streptococcus agalactiae]
MYLTTCPKGRQALSFPLYFTLLQLNCIFFIKLILSFCYNILAPILLLISDNLI